MRFLYPLAVLSLGTLPACHHATQGPAYDLSGRYISAATLTAANPPTLYTTSGAVTDGAATSRFLYRHRAIRLGDLFAATDVPVPAGYPVTLVFRAGNRATLLSGADSTRLEVTDQQPASLLLQSLDSTSQYGVTSFPQGQCTHNGELFEAMRSTVAGKSCRIVSPATGYTQFCRIRPVRVVGAHGSQLYVPYYSCYVQANGCYSTLAGEWNTFNPAVLSRLQPGDTLLVQEREIALRR